MSSWLPIVRITILSNSDFRGILLRRISCAIVQYIFFKIPLRQQAAIRIPECNINDNLILRIVSKMDGYATCDMGCPKVNHFRTFS
jgi:hypothetical protein